MLLSLFLLLQLLLLLLLLLLFWLLLLLFMLSLVWAGLVIVFVVVEISVGDGLLFESVFNSFINSSLLIS